MIITQEQLKSCYSSASLKNIQVFLPLLNKYMEEYHISTRNRVVNYLPQVGHESGQLIYTKEIASGKSYEGRKDLGNIYTGDGVKFKGRGIIQITGRANYEKVSEAFGIDLISNPELLETPDLAVRSACWWWANRVYAKKSLNEWADLNTEQSFKNITKAINGGLNGYTDRLNLWNRAQKAIPSG